MQVVTECSYLVETSLMPAMCLHSLSAVSSPPPKLPVSETYWRLSIMPSFQ